MADLAQNGEFSSDMFNILDNTKASRSGNLNIVFAGQFLTIPSPLKGAAASRKISANAIAAYQKWIFDNLYKQELQKYQKHETNLLHQQEQEIEQEKSRVETELRMARAELESTTQATKEAVNFWKPEYA